MAHFVFALEGVLRQRSHLEQECQRKVAAAQQKMRQAQDVLRELDQAMQHSLADVRQNRLVGRIDLGFLAAYRRYVASVQRKGTTMAQSMALIQREIDAAKAELANAAKERKIIEKLKEKQFERWKTEVARKDAAEMDDVSSRMAAARIADARAVEDQATIS
jgi:flagellar FliJ protein